MSVHVPKHICGQYLCEKANARQQSGSSSVQVLRNEHYIYSCCVSSYSQIYFWSIPLWTITCMDNKVENMACRNWEMDTIFAVAVPVHVPKYIYAQFLCEQANAGTEKWELWRVELEK